MSTSAPALASTFPRWPPSTTPVASIATARSALVLVMRVSVPRRLPSFHVAVSTELSASSSSSSSSADEADEQQVAARIGRRVRVKAPLKIYHVQKAPELDLNGLEGVIMECVGDWNGKRISANLPFKVQFEIGVQVQPRPVKFVAHLREDEFEYLPSSD